MELKEFIVNFAKQFEDTDVADIQANTEFKNLDEWSSLIGMCVIALAKTQYGKSITGTDIRSCRTVEDLFKLIASK
jgi:acyl carrier protein